MMMPPTPLEFWARFGSRIVKDQATGCWCWTGAAVPKGYGHAHVSGRYVYIHRLALETFRPGSLTAEKPFALHRCDTPPCCNPDHLFSGTFSDNAKDRERKGRGRSARGERNVNAKLTASKVMEIRQRVAAGETRRALSRVYGVSRTLINVIVCGQTWKHVGGDLTLRGRPGAVKQNTGA